MKKNIIIILIAFICIYPLYAQYLNVRISTVVLGEECVAINPKNTNQIAVGVMAYYSSNSRISYYYSTNSGMNWDGGPILSTIGQPFGDPVMIADTAGNFYYITCADINPWLDKLLCFKSTNGGTNWNNGTPFAQVYPKSDDMPMGCVDFSNSIYRNNIYVTWTLYDSAGGINPNDSSYVYFARSTNEGGTFTTPKRVGMIAGHSYYDNTCPEGPVPCTGTNGELYVCFPHSEQVYFNRSTDAGDTWLNSDILVSTQPGGWYPHQSPVISCDISNSIYRGNVYICFSDLRNGVNDRDIWFTKSTNRGDSWNTPIRVNDDSPGHLQELPWMCVDPVTGFIWIVFYDTRNYANNNYGDVFIARSTNGGTSFQNTRVSNSSTFMLNWLGDYIGISAYNNKVRPVWTRYIDGSHNELWTAIIDTFIIGIKPISNNIPVKFNLYQNYPNPFNPKTKIKFDITPSPEREGGGEVITLKIYNVLGKEVAYLIPPLREGQGGLQPGTYEIEWDGTNYPGGVYFYKFSATGEAGNYTKTNKMILLK